MGARERACVRVGVRVSNVRETGVLVVMVVGRRVAQQAGASASRLAAPSAMPGPNIATTSMPIALFD